MKDDEKDKKKQSDKRVSVFNRLGTRTTRLFIFERLGTPTQLPTFKNSSPHVITLYLRDLICNHVSIQNNSDSEVSEDEIQEAPPQLEDSGQATVDELKELNFGTLEKLWPIFVSALLSLDEEKKYFDILFEYRDVFAWTYKEILGLDPKVAIHQLGIRHGTRAVKQSQCVLLPDLIPRIEAKVKKRIKARFIREVKYPIWISNEECTTFCTPKGIFCYKAMPFGLKNASATYQQAMQNIFNDMLHKRVECYVGDLVVKTKKREDHLKDLHTKMPVPRNLKELQSLHENLAFIRRFISNFTGRCQPFNHLMKKDAPFVWDKGRENAFQSIKRYLSNPPILRAMNTIKGQTLANFLADHPIPAEWELSDEFLDEDTLFVEILPAWMMFFDGATRSDEAGARVVFVSLEKHVLTYSIVLNKLCSNNVVEYQAYGDSNLVINQLLNVYEVKKDDLVPYFQQVSSLLRKFEDIVLRHVPRKKNKLVDALANLATTLGLSEGETTNVPVCNRWILPSLAKSDHEDANAVSVSRTPLIDYLKEGRLPQDPYHRTERRLNSQETVDASAHLGVYGAHQSGPKLHFQIKRMGYYWPTMVKDCLEYTKRCEASSSSHNCFLAFDAWGLDVIRPIPPKSSCGHAYIMAATDYFFKWAKAVPLEEGKKETVLIDKLCAQFEFKQYSSSMSNTVTNGLAEVFNKTLCNLLKKVVSKLRRDWHEKGLIAKDNIGLQLEELEALDEKKLEAQQQLECYQAHMRMGNKFTSKWHDPYVVKEVYTNGAYKLVDKDGQRIGPINGKFLKRYYPQRSLLRNA
ncbi:DNA-directed DNA polymerase [Handroanthus impetiginosus]|uniref:DNA-directed DNA polymerase n=1 Tax=Handroanthus impetiginosus TaxID=429701 RepID=A0A2G9I440_9LAMI|nr:DNA-directed DNA polymerase [Handroanthus impetiginosus]